jgi:hypothetical protein
MPFADREVPLLVADNMADNMADTHKEEFGCSFILDADRSGDTGSFGPRFCDAPRHPDSSYCARHHAICHLPGGSAAEDLRLREIEALAQVAGGKYGREVPCPPPGLLRRLVRVSRAFSRPSCSRIVRRSGQ